MAVTEAMENYLETVLILSRENSEVHAANICAYLDYSRPTVSIAIRQLRDQGYLTIDASNHITLTPAGLAIAEPMYERHNILANVLEKLGVSRETALRDACKIEHDLSPETFEKIREHYKRTRH